MIDTSFNYLIGKAELLPEKYDYKNRPDPDTDGCKKLYDDLIKAFFHKEAFFHDTDEVSNCEQPQYYYKKPDPKELKDSWDAYEALKNENPKPRDNNKRPPFYTIEYYTIEDKVKPKYRLSSDYIGPSVYWAKESKLDDTKIIDFLNVCRTIGGHIVWPRGGEGETVNQARGGESSFYDRIDWTLFLVKQYYDHQLDRNSTKDFLKQKFETDTCDRCDSVLKAIENYKTWFEEFSGFSSFCDQFKLKGSFVDSNYGITWLAPPSPVFPKNYELFVQNNVKAVKNRNDKIENSKRQN